MANKKKGVAKTSKATKTVKTPETSTKEIEKIIVEEQEELENEVVEENTKQEETFENGKKTSIIKLAWNVCFWTCFVIIFVIWIVDFYNVRTEKKPMFCIQNKTHKFDDGTVDECVGVGYKVYTYHRKSINVKSQFTPFFVGMEK